MVENGSAVCCILYILRILPVFICICVCGVFTKHTKENYALTHMVNEVDAIYFCLYVCVCVFVFLFLLCNDVLV